MNYFALERLSSLFSNPPEIDPAVMAVEALAPRFILTFGIAPLQGLPDGCAQFAIDAPEPAGDSAAVSVDVYFARAIHTTLNVSSRHRPWFFDLAIIGPDYRLGERRRILGLLQPTAHSRSAALFLRRATSQPARSLRDARAGLQDSFANLDFAAITSRQPGLLVGGLDLAKPTMQAPPREPGRRLSPSSLAAFLAQHRIERLPISAEPVIADDAPGLAGADVIPRYSNIATGGEPWEPAPGRNRRSLSRWWGNPLRLIDARVSSARDIGFVSADGATRSLLIDWQGLPLASSYRYWAGYGLDPGAATMQMQPACLSAADGRRRPMQDAKSALTGRYEPGDFYLIGWIDPRFGHFLVESLASTWALEWALARGMRFLLWSNLKGYQRSAFEMLGIPADRIVFAEPGTTYERLYMPEPAFRLVGSVSPAASWAWDRMARAAIAADGNASSGPATEPFLYLSRAGISNRRLSNELELEALLAERGGKILRPETLPFDEQVRAVRRSRAVVGCFGSQLHLSMFQAPGARKLVIGGEHFTGSDETLISIARGTRIDHYIEPIHSSRAMSARFESWTIDLDRFAKAFDNWLADDRDAPPFTTLPTT